jgi:hypothetical protein
MKSNRLDAQDNFLSWMRLVNKRITRMERKGRVDLLGATTEDAARDGQLAVRTFSEIPELEPGTAVHVLDEDVVYVQDSMTRAWQAAP